MGVTRLAISDKQKEIKAHISYFGGGENQYSDSFDFGTLKENLDNHLKSLNVIEESDA